MKTISEYINERQLGQGWKEWEEDGCKICMLAFKQPSEEYGIDGGKISKLQIRKGYQILCNYDRGWDVQPSDDIKKLYDKIIKKYN